MAFSIIILSIAVFSTSIYALAFPGPLATSVSEKNEGMLHSGWTPRPTPGPKLPHELLKRQIAGQTVFVAPDRTCGFISGLPEAEFRCPETDSCVLFPTTGTGWGSVGCCNSESCGSRLACVDFDQYSTSSLCDIDCELDTAIQKCTDAETPYCNTVRFPLEGVQDYFCGTLSASTIQEALTTYDAETGRTVSTMIVSDSLPFSLHSASTAVAGSSTTSSAAASASETIHHGSTTTIISEGPSTKHPTTIIIGGVVGGAVAITLLSLVIFFFCRKRGTQAPRKSSQTSSLSPPAYTIYGGQQELGTIVLSGAITHPAPTKSPKIRTSNG